MDHAVKAPSVGRGWPLWGFVVGIAGCLLLFRQLLGPDGKGLMWADNFDSSLVVYLLEWGRHALVDLRAPLAFFDCNFFYPLPGALAVTESFLGAQVFYTPLRLLGFDIPRAMYLTAALTSLFGAVLTDRALVRLGVTGALERIVCVFSAHFALPMTSFFYHFQCFGWQLAPPFFLYLCLWLRDFRRGDIVVSTGLYMFAACWSAYLAPMLLLLAIIVAAMPLYRVVRADGLRRFFLDRVGLPTLAAIALGALLLFVFQLRPYFELARTMPPAGFNEANGFSAGRLSLFRGFSIYSLWYTPGGYGGGDWERAYFPGYVLLGGLFSAALLARWRRKRGISDDAPGLRLLFRSMAVLFVACWLLSFGPFMKRNGIRLPYWFLTFVMPGLKGVRTPGRFGIFFGLPLGLLLIYAVRGLKARPRIRQIALPLVAVALVIESIPIHPTFPFIIPHEAEYREVKRLIAPGTPLFEAPIKVGDHLETLVNVMGQLKGSTIHWGRVLVGYGAKETPEFAEASALEEGVRLGKRPFDDLVAFLSRLHVPYVLAHVDQMTDEEAARWRQFSQTSAVRNVEVLGRSLLLRLNVVD